MAMTYLFALCGSRAAMHARLIVGYERQPTAQTKCVLPAMAMGGIAAGMATVLTMAEAF